MPFPGERAADWIRKVKTVKPISLIMLVYNEAEVIERVVRDYYSEIVEKIPGSEFIVAEDGSTDGTKEILGKLEGEIPIRLVRGERRKGYLGALRDALAIPRNDIVFFSDSDGQHTPACFWKMLPEIEHYDMVIGSKTQRKDSGYRLLISRVLNIIVGLSFKVWFWDINSGFRLFRKDVSEGLLKEPWYFKECPFTEFTIRAHMRGHPITEVAVEHHTREFGASRGLPPRRIPGAIFNILWSIRKLRAEAKRKGVL